MGKVSDVQSSERLSSLEKEVVSLQETIAFLGMVTDPIPGMQAYLSLLKDHTVTTQNGRIMD